MKIAFAASEVVPFAKTGGLADVAGALPVELAKMGHDVKIFMPKYYSINEHEYGHQYLSSVGEIPVRVGGHLHSVHLFKGLMPNSSAEIYFIHYPNYFHRDKFYTSDWDEDQRFILFAKAVIESIQRLGWAPDIIHCNDWQTGLIPLYIKDNYSWDKLFANTASLFTIHNVAYQGRFGHGTLTNAEIRSDLYYPGGPVEFENTVSFLKTGIVFADIINTVSETYAREILTNEYGAGMQFVLREREHELYGIINGVDYEVWNPETDKYIPHHFSINDLSGKIRNKKFLLTRMGLPFDENVPLIGIVSRMVAQKGFDLLAQVINELMKLDCQFIIVGTGEDKYENLCRSMEFYFKDKVRVYIGYSNELAHLTEAASDMFLMPSRYEPCGLNQIYSLRYGTVPIVRKTGGLADTVQDWNEYNSYGMETGTGYSFEAYEGFALENAVKRAINDFHNKPVWEKIMKNGMTRDYSWHKSAERYLELYNKAISKRHG